MEKRSITFKNKLIFAAACCLILLLQQTGISQQLAFPGAEGFGKYAIGGRTGSVYHVTNLNNAGPGSLRDAVSVSNRIVVFDVGGVIKITERMIVSANIYLAGQTAPGEGITVYGNGWSFSNAHNTICRYIKIRMGIVGTSGKDANGIADGHDMIFDHCSVSWGRDENFSINSSTSTNITIQNSIISQGLLTHSAGGLIQAPGGITLYRNLYADNGTRNNKVKGINQYVNNIVYNWSAGAYIMGGDSQGESFVNTVGNNFIQGPVDGTSPFSVGNNLFHIYATDNLHDNNRNGIYDPYLIPQNEFGGGPDFQPVPYNYPILPTIPANTVLNDVLPFVGASLPYRDLADYYVVNEVKSFGRTGALIANENVLPFGVPTAWALWPGTLRTDTDNDGMPDAWETANGLNPNSAADGMIITGTGYTNLENYINGINASYSQSYLRSPLNLKADSATQNSIYFSWFDYTEQEQGYIFERKVNGVFVQIGTTGVNENHFTLPGLAPEEKDTFRVKAFNASGSSGYSNELIAKTKPVTVPVIDPDTFVPDLTWTASVNETWDYTTTNWLKNSLPDVFTDSSKLLFPEAGGTGHAITINAQVGPKDILVNSNGDYSFSGAGFIAGSGSMNKVGSGKLSLLNNNTYTGATVLRNGILEIDKLANGLLPSSIGASANYGFNWVWKGGKINYTGATTTTDRSAVLDNTTEFSVSNAASTVTLTGILTGSGGLTKSGPGKLVLKSANPYEGETIIKGGTIEVIPVSIATEIEDIIDNGAAIGTSNILRLQGGTYKTSGGSTTIYENYPMHIYVDDNTVNGFEPYRNANLNCDVTGNGTLNYAITYSRELIQGDWSQFTGTLVANGIGLLTGGERSTLMIDNGIGFPSTRVLTAGNTKIASYQNAQTLYLGGLSGPAGTNLSCGSKTSGGIITWSVGGAGTDETFNGVINNEAYSSTSNSSGVTTIIKEGNGLWRLTGNNIYTGTTNVNGGTLVVNGIHTGTGKVTVTEGILAGKGSLAGDVEVATILQPGDNSINTFTIKGKLILQTSSTVQIDVNKTTATWDKLPVTGDIIYAGTLEVSFTGTPVAGDVFKIFTPGAGVSGTFAQILPAAPAAGLEWRFIPATGELLVVTPGFVYAPGNLQLSATTTELPSPHSIITLNWQDNSDNEDYFILERSPDGTSFTDIAHPVANITSYIDSIGLIPSTTYYYRIKAHGASQESAYSSIASIKTPDLPTPPAAASNPSPANGLQTVALNAGSLTLGWTGSSNTETFAVYFGTSSGSLTKLADVPYSASPVYLVNSLSFNTTYYWRIDATNFKGTTVGTVWSFKTADIPTTVAGDYRTASSGNWGSGTVATNIWEMYDGTNWISTTTQPLGVTPPSTVVVNTVTIRAGHVVTLNATTTVNNLVIETGATLKSGTSDGLAGTATSRTLRVSRNVFNYGTFGSSSTAAERITFEGYLDNGTIILAGSSRYNLTNFSVNSLAVTVEAQIDADLNITGFFRAFFNGATTGPWTGSPQNDDNITVTINAGKTVTLGSSSYLHVTNAPTTNTIFEYGNYTYNINGILDMKATGTSCIVAHSTIAKTTTININGTWYTGNAMRLITTAATLPAGAVAFNIGNGGLVDAGARYTASITTTNLVVANTTTGQTVFFNISGNGVLKNRVATSDVTYPIGTGGTYSPAKLNNTGTADMIAVGVKNTFSNPVNNSNVLVKKEFLITPTTVGVVNLTIYLGWLTGDHASGFNPTSAVIGHFGPGAWDETPAVITGAGTLSNPYYAKASGFTSFSPFGVGNANAFAFGVLPLRLLSFNAIYTGNRVNTSWETSNEINVKDFDIERGTDGVNFITIGNKPAYNLSGNMHYVFSDDNPLNGISYYRLKMIDKDGKFSYSKIVRINSKSDNLLSAFPNPAINTVTIAYPLQGAATTLKLYTPGGNLVKVIYIMPGSTQTELNISNLAKGTYLIQMGDKSISSLKLLKE